MVRSSWCMRVGRLATMLVAGVVSGAAGVLCVNYVNQQPYMLSQLHELLAQMASS